MISSAVLNNVIELSNLWFYIRSDLHTYYSCGIGNNTVVVLRTGLDLVDKFHSGYHTSPYGVLPVKERRRCEADEKLAVGTVGKRSARHGDGAPDMLLARKFCLKLLAGTAAAVAERIAGLSHKSWYNTVEGESVIKTFAGQFFDARHMAGGDIWEHLDDDSS